VAKCIEDPRDPNAVQHSIAEMIRFRALLIAAGYADANDSDALRADPAFKMAVGRLPESGAELCSQPTMSRLENLPGPIALMRMMAAMVNLFCDSFATVPSRIVLDIDDTEDAVHGGQQSALFNAHYDSHCFLPMHVYEAQSGKPVATILRLWPHRSHDLVRTQPRRGAARPPQPSCLPAGARRSRSGIAAVPCHSGRTRCEGIRESGREGSGALDAVIAARHATRRRTRLGRPPGMH
jgi:hypothetical protein